MTEEKTVPYDDDWGAWTGEELHAYFDAVGTNAAVAEAAINDALNDDFRALIVAQVGEDGQFPDELHIPTGWKPLHVLGINPAYLLGFAWIPTRREQPGVSFAQFEREVNGTDLLTSYVESIVARLPQEPDAEPPAGDAPLGETSQPQTSTSPPSRTKSSSPTGSSKRSKKSARSSSTSSRS